MRDNGPPCPATAGNLSFMRSRRLRTSSYCTRLASSKFLMRLMSDLAFTVAAHEVAKSTTVAVIPGRGASPWGVQQCRGVGRGPRRLLGGPCTETRQHAAHSLCETAFVLHQEHISDICKRSQAG